VVARAAATTATAATTLARRTVVGEAATFARAAAQEGHLVGDDLGHVALLAGGLVVPRAGLQTPLDVAGATLVEILRTVLSGLAPHHDAMPLGAFLPLLALVGEHFVGGDSHLAHRL